MTNKPFPAQFSAGDRVALALSYDGSAFHGWQSQRKPQVATVQETLELALSHIANTSMTVQCAGRTDAGVHASHQVVHFITPVQRDEKSWVSGCNSKLPDGVAVRWAKPVNEGFHARFSATARRYRYIIINTPARPALLSKGITWISRPLDEVAMHQAAQSLVGTHDFTSYRAVACQSNSPKRSVKFINVSRRGELIIIDIQANAFLQHMVRNIAGVLVDIGAGLQTQEWAYQVLLAKNRCVSAATAPPFGLYLIDVHYPEHFALPATSLGPYFIA